MPFRSTTELQQLCPPEEFGLVERGIYRSNSLIPVNFPFLKTLDLKAVIQLSPEVPIKAVTTFFRENGMKHVHLGLKAWKPSTTWKPVTEELIKEALEMALDVNNHPIMVMCSSGIHQTGTLVGCLRRLQNWSLTSILVEYRSYASNRSTRYGDEQFIELFDVDLVTLPDRLPQWFVEQRKMMVIHFVKSLFQEEEEEEERQQTEEKPTFQIKELSLSS